MLVAKTISVMNGKSNFCPVCSVRKSTRLSSGTIHRFRQIARRARLTAEIVDDQHAAVGDRLHRRPVEPHRRAVAQLELVERQLAADHDHGPAAADPAMIVVAGRDPDRPGLAGSGSGS